MKVKNKKVILIISFIIFALVILVIGYFLLKNKFNSKLRKNEITEKQEEVIENNTIDEIENEITEDIENKLESDNEVAGVDENTNDVEVLEKSNTQANTSMNKSSKENSQTTQTSTQPSTTPSQSITPKHTPFTESKRVRNTSLEATIVNTLNEEIAKVDITSLGNGYTKGKAIVSTQAKTLNTKYFTYRNTAQIKAMIINELSATCTYYVCCEDVYMWDSSGENEYVWHTNCYVHCLETGHSY